MNWIFQVSTLNIKKQSTYKKRLLAFSNKSRSSHSSSLKKCLFLLDKK